MNYKAIGHDGLNDENWGFVIFEFDDGVKAICSTREVFPRNDFYGVSFRHSYLGLVFKSEADLSGNIPEWKLKNATANLEKALKDDAYKSDYARAKSRLDSESQKAREFRIKNEQGLIALSKKIGGPVTF